MQTLDGRLKLTPLSLQDILLDPNNPRLYGERETTTRIPDARIAETKVQESTFSKIGSRKFGVGDLRNSILQVGFLPIDKIVVRPINGGKYVVVEGNRRVAALKWIIRDHEEGELTLEDTTIKTLSAVECLILETDADWVEQDRWLIQGVRHVSGVKDWGPYEKALAVRSFIEDQEFAPRETAEALGTTTNEVNRLYRALGAFEQMREDESYGEHARPEIFSYFIEALGKPNVRAWLGYEEDSRNFQDDDNRERFYSLIVPGENDVRKLPMAIDVRRFSKVVESEKPLQVLESEGGTLDAAIAATLATDVYDWRTPLTEAERALNNIPAGDLESGHVEDRELIMHLHDLCEKRLAQFSTPTG